MREKVNRKIKTGKDCVKINRKTKFESVCAENFLRKLSNGRNRNGNRKWKLVMLRAQVSTKPKW